MADAHHQLYADEGLGLHTHMENEDEEDAIVVEEFEGQHQIGDVIGRDELMAGAPVEAVHPSEIYAPPGVNFSGGGGSGSSPNQFTLSFQGEVFVFDDVSPEKVRAVLLLLGGYEVPSNGSMGPIPKDQRPVDDNHDMYGRPIPPQRAAALSRFREKKKDRCFDKKIRYTVRKEVAHRMQRRKGQFVSAKASSEDMGSASSDGNGPSGAVKEEHETSCKNCGTSYKKTPMMRRGPAGPRTLCNACGLKWANKVVSEKCPRGLALRIHNASVKVARQRECKMNDSDAIPTVTDIFCFTSDNSTIIADE